MARHSTARKAQERSLATRAALLDAALESLVEKGYAGTTTLETARRAGVSRGAQQHHFRSRAELLAAAVETLLERRLAEFERALAEAASTSDVHPIEAAIDILWQMFQGPAFVAWLELWVAARTDPQLAATVLAMDRRFDEESTAMFEQLRGDAGNTLADIGRDFAFALMNGIALVRLHPHGERPAADHLAVLKLLARESRGAGAAA